MASVTMSNQNIEGAFKNPIAAPPVAATPGASGGGAATAVPQSTSAKPVTYSEFTTTMPVQGDNRLLPLLE